MLPSLLAQATYSSDEDDISERGSLQTGGLALRNSTVGAECAAAFRIARFFADFFGSRPKMAGTIITSLFAGKNGG